MPRSGPAWLWLVSLAVAAGAAAAATDWFVRSERAREDGIRIAVASMADRPYGIRTAEDLAVHERVPFDAYRGILLAALGNDDRGAQGEVVRSVQRVLASGSPAAQAMKRGVATFPILVSVAASGPDEAARAIVGEIGRELAARENVVVGRDERGAARTVVSCSQQDLCDRLGGAVADILRANGVEPVEVQKARPAEATALRTMDIQVVVPPGKAPAPAAVAHGTPAAHPDGAHRGKPHRPGG